MGGMSPSITRRAAALLGAAAALQPARAERARYNFDQAVGQLGFSARHLGMFSSYGRFDRFRADLMLDPARPAEAGAGPAPPGRAGPAPPGGAAG